MCGIFGAIIKKDTITLKEHENLIRNLFLLSESRGKEASGFAAVNNVKFEVLKSPSPASVLIKSTEYKQVISKLVNIGQFSMIGHSRLVTNGYEQFNENNQPFVKNKIAGVHNGIIVNIDELWQKYNDEIKTSDLDSEIIPTLIRRSINYGLTINQSIKNLYTEISGMTTLALLPADFNNMLLATNNGSLYYLHNHQVFLFASEFFILSQLIRENGLSRIFTASDIKQLKPNHACSVNYMTLVLSVCNIKLESENFNNIEIRKAEAAFHEIESKIDKSTSYINRSMEYTPVELPKEFLNHIENAQNQISRLNRCTRCLLPETFPFIEFDEQGICSVCKNYIPQQIKGADILAKKADKYRRNDDRPDCIVAFSGGRDSSYMLHYVKKVLKLNPIAYSYDWGMLTDLGRRNQSRMCGQLGVEHILVSADIRKKRRNVSKNVEAWLKHPHLGTIPLFMAGDKQYFYYAEKIKQQNNIDLLIMGENLFEKTGFKIEFSGVRQQKKGFMSYHISTGAKLKMLLFYARQYIKNPAYINSSLLDTLGAFFSYYALSHSYLNIYNYIQWNENEVDNILLNQYNWETDPETHTTWRIGDGTAAFYNYIYYIVAGFSENDTLRSNQIRENVLLREEGLKLITEENKPRWKSIKWYLDTIGLDFGYTMQIINKIPSLY